MSSNAPDNPKIAAPSTSKPTSTGGKSKSKTVTKASGAGTQAKAKKPARKKKTTSKSSSAAAAQAILSSARAAQLDLAKQKAQGAAKRTDPLWYRIEDVLPFPGEGDAMVGNTNILPEQVQIVESVLGKNGLTRSDVTPQAMACLLEQSRRFAHELITNAQDYAYSANRAEITRPDLLLASEMRADYKMEISTQLPKLNLVAQHVNRAPLPPIPSQCFSGVLLPPKEHQLTARTYDIVSGARVTQKMVQKIPEAPKKRKSGAASGHTSYGAARGRQIPVKLKDPQPSSSPAKSQISTAMDVSPTGSKTSPTGRSSSYPGQPVQAPAVPSAGSAPVAGLDPSGSTTQAPPSASSGSGSVPPPK